MTEKETEVDEVIEDTATTSLYERVSSFENLLHAYRRAVRGKRNRPDVATFDYYLEGNLLQLRNQMRSHLYRPGPYHRFAISDPKPRVISAAPFRDRVVHHALCNVIEPLFERRFISDSYASRRGKGIHQALDRCAHFARRYRYVLRCDIVQFFPSVDLAILRRILARVIREDETLLLCDLILAGGAHELTDQYDLVLFPGDDPDEAAQRARGLPIGNQTSQFWANCYLNPLDHFIKEELRCRAYLRYVDDFLLFADDKRTLHLWKRSIIDFLATHLRLILHERESVVSPVIEGIPFLGFRIHPDHRLLRRRNGVSFSRRLRRMRQDYHAGLLDIAEVTPRVQGWVAHVEHGDTWGLRSSLLSHEVFVPPGATPDDRPEGIASLREDV